jgi:HSP20 family protein
MPVDIFNFDPFVELNAYRDALRQLVESGRVNARDLMPSAVAAVVIPVDLLDTGPELVVQANLPGVRPEELNVTITGSILTIKGSIPEQKSFQGAAYLRQERRAASFSRSVALPIAVDSEQGRAALKDGVLTLTLPKAETVRPKNIRIVQD